VDAFVRIQKSGSTSLKVATQDSKLVKTLPHAYSYPIGKVRGWRWNNRFPTFDPNKYESVKAVVRNPFEILVSYYHHTHKGSKGLDGWADCNKVHGFDSWSDFLSAYLEPTFEWHLPPMKTSMFSFAYDKNGNLVIDQFFKLEEPNLINRYLKSKRCKPLPVKNKTAAKGDINYYTKSEISELRKIWSRDLDYFGY
jgi:hypothetical protein